MKFFKHAWIIAKRETGAMFVSPIAYVCLSGSASPAAPMPPIFRKLRRDSPSQNCCFRSRGPKMVSIRCRSLVLFPLRAVSSVKAPGRRFPSTRTGP